MFNISAAKIIGLATLTTLLIACAKSAPAVPPQNGWQKVQPGLNYLHQTIQHNSYAKEFFLVTIDPKHFQFKIYQNSDEQKAKSLETIHNETHALMTFNGTFFDNEFKAMGLLISEGKTLHQKSKSQLSNGIFSINNNGDSKLSSVENFHANNETSFAIQNGPILIDPQGKIAIQKETGNSASRTIIGKTKNGQIMVIILQQNLFQPNSSMTLYEIAHLLKQSPEFKDYGLTSVINLDGGTSTGAIINDESFAEIRPVQNAITISAIIAP